MTDADLNKFKRWLIGVLKTGPTTIKFVKKDGTKRTMNCTLKADLVPQIISETTKKDRKTNPEVLSIYDLENKAWKSFRWDSLKEVIITI